MRSRTLLIVTADAKLRAAVRAAAGRSASVLFADSGLRALFLCASHAVDLVLIDEQTPGMSSARLREKLSGAFPELPVDSIRDDVTGQVQAFLEAPQRKAPAVLWLPQMRGERGA